jgi:hypothetical protein
MKADARTLLPHLHLASHDEILRLSRRLVESTLGSSDRSESNAPSTPDGY